jgi:hypothetical protein
MQGFRETLWRYWVVVVCAAAITGLVGAAGANVATKSRYRVIDVVVPDEDPRHPATLVEAMPGAFDIGAATDRVNLGTHEAQQVGSADGVAALQIAVLPR